MKAELIKEKICNKAKELGFNGVSFLAAKPLLESEKRFLEWREKGFAADMNYLLKDDPINARPHYLLEDAKTIIMFTVNYFSPCPPRPSLEHGRVAAYATGLDYHKVLRKKLKELVEDDEIKECFKNSKFFTDAVPLLEKSFAKKAGLGFRGRNTLLISKETGSFNFILEIITDLDLIDGTTEEGSFPSSDNNCGQCTRCMDICPTDALPIEYQLDARKCISYHTIENKAEIPKELASKFGEWVFGCDLCQTICPYNKNFERKLNDDLASIKEFQPESGFGHWLYLPEIIELEPGSHKTKFALIEKLETHKFIDNKTLNYLKKFIEKQDDLNDEVYDHVYQSKFARTPLLRPKRKGLIRNAKIVLENSKC